VSRLSKKCGSLDVSQTHATPRPVTGTALNKLRGFQSASELHRPSDRCLSAKLVATFCG
jgi:hypothetical protein